METTTRPGLRLTPCLWFNGNAEEAYELYASLFADAHLTTELTTPEGALLTGTLHLAGQSFMIINAASDFSFTESVSLFVSCPDQAEVDRLWIGLTADGGMESQCGWLKDRFGLSWQIVPTRLGELLGDPDPQVAGRVMQAMLQMTRIDLAQLEAARLGTAPPDTGGSNTGESGTGDRPIG